MATSATRLGKNDIEAIEASILFAREVVRGCLPIGMGLDHLLTSVPLAAVPTDVLSSLPAVDAGS